MLACLVLFAVALAYVAGLASALHLAPRTRHLLARWRQRRRRPAREPTPSNPTCDEPSASPPALGREPVAAADATAIGAVLGDALVAVAVAASASATTDVVTDPGVGATPTTETGLALSMETGLAMPTESALAYPTETGAAETGLAIPTEGLTEDDGIAEATEARAEDAVASEVRAAMGALRFEPIVDRNTPAWSAEMAKVGERYAGAGVSAVIFAHGTFAGSDPLSAYKVVERTLPAAIGPSLARTLRKKTRSYIERVLGDVGNFGSEYVRLFETAIRPTGASIPCTEFIWSSENNHVGRLEGALGLLRVLATHADLARERRLLVMGHSHAGQLFALVTQLLARSIATEAILDIARVRGLDVVALEADLDMLATCKLDFVTFGSPARYAWATIPRVRALHVITPADWIRRLGVEGSDFPPLDGEDRRINTALAASLGGAGFAPTRVAAALRAGLGLPATGIVAIVDYGEKGLSGAFSSGLGHGAYTRLDGMLFHARLVADRLYPDSAESTRSALRDASRSLRLAPL